MKTLTFPKEEKSVSATSPVLLCAATYFVSCMTRLNYSAVLLEIQNSTGFRASRFRSP